MERLGGWENPLSATFEYIIVQNPPLSWGGKAGAEGAAAPNPDKSGALPPHTTIFAEVHAYCKHVRVLSICIALCRHPIIIIIHFHHHTTITLSQ